MPTLPSCPLLPYQQASRCQQDQALDYVRRELAQHFPTLTDESLRQVLRDLQPPLELVADEAVALGHLHLTHIVQRLATTEERATLDPPIYGPDAEYLARQLCFFARQARLVLAQPAAPALPTAGQALLARLAVGNAVAERVLAAHLWLPEQLAGLIEELD